MIFVTVGTQKFQFNRLIKAIDDLVSEKKIKEEVFAQIGNSDYVPINFPYARSISSEEFNERINKCDILISHSGVATIVKGLLAEKKVIVVPRLKKFGEHVDNHQIQIADSFSDNNYILQCIDIKDLEDTLDKVGQHSFAVYKSKRADMIDTIDKYIDDL